MTKSDPLCSISITPITNFSAMTEKLSIQMARNIMLAAQGLDRPPDQPATKADVLAVIRRMYLLQIDTINVVARSPYLVLWSRLGDYPPE